jgi:predicted Zn-dependent protease
VTRANRLAPAKPVPRRRQRAPFWLWLAGAAILLAAVGGFLGWRQEQWRATRADALRLAKQNQFAEAEPLLQVVLSRKPDDVEVLRALAMSRLSARKPEEAESYLARWIDLRPNDTEPLNQRMYLWASWHRLPEAIEDARHLLQLDPNLLVIRQALADWLAGVGHYDEAEREYLLGLEQQPGDPTLLFGLAQVCHRKGDAARAASLTDEVLHKAPLNRMAMLLRAILYVEDNQPEKAISLLREVLAATNEPNQVARYYLSLALAQTGQAEEAQKVQAEMTAEEDRRIWAGRGHEPNPGLLLRSAESLQAVGKSEEAMRLVDMVLEQDPDSPAAHRLLADYYEKHGQTAKAAEHKRRADRSRHSWSAHGGGNPGRRAGVRHLAVDGRPLAHAFDRPR